MKSTVSATVKLRNAAPIEIPAIDLTQKMDFAGLNIQAMAKAIAIANADPNLATPYAGKDVERISLHFDTNFESVEER
jgi:hypothetical protein